MSRCRTETYGARCFLYLCRLPPCRQLLRFFRILSHMRATALAGARKKSVLINIVLVTLLSMPCVLGFNLWSSFTPLGADSNILDLEDFIVSNNLLPIGSLIYCLFCVTRYGWGFDRFLEECNTGKGMKFPRAMRPYLAYVLAGGDSLHFCAGLHCKILSNVKIFS